MEKFEITDRYKALGIPYPDPETMCKGQCEGIGVIPHYNGGKLKTSQDGIFEKLWEIEHAKHRGTEEGDLCDGWHFIKCPDCNGTGKLSIS